MGFRFLHAANLHLDSPFTGLSPVPPELREPLRDASLRAFDQMVDLAISLNVDAVLLAGDTYDGPDRGLRAQQHFLAGLERLSGWSIPTVIVQSARDPADGWSAIASWPRDVTLIGTGRVERVEIVRLGTPVATVYGRSSSQAMPDAELARGIRRGGGPGVQIGLLPGGTDDLPGPDEGGMDYWALGGGHERQVLRAGHPWIVTPGTTQGRGTHASERGAKGVYIVSVDNETIHPPEFVPIDAVRFLRLELDARNATDLPALRQALLEQAASLHRGQEGRPVVLDAVVHGQSALHPTLRQPGVRDELLRDLREASAGQAPFLWWNTLQDATRPEQDRSEIRERGDFTAELLRVKEDLTADPAALRRFAAERLDAIRHGPLARLVPEPDAAALTDLLDAAELLAVDLLEE